jgi:hypothetical protein
MSIIIRVLIIVACAYAGSAVASGQFALPSRQLTTVTLNRAGFCQPGKFVEGDARSAFKRLGCRTLQGPHSCA